MTAACVAVSQKGDASPSLRHWGPFLQNLMTLCARKMRCKSKEESTMHLFPALSETQVVGKNEKACVSVPTLLFTN